MDLRKHSYYFATSIIHAPTGRPAIKGCDFEAKRSDSYETFLQQPYEVSREQSRMLSTSLSSRHVNSRGWYLEIDSLEYLSTPCLLTSDQEIAWVYSGPVNIEFPDAIENIEEVFDQPTAAIGHDWIGVLSSQDTGFWLEAFSHSPIKRTVELPAYLLDWDDRFDDETAVLRISFT